MVAGRVGISPETWENMTPVSFRAYVKGYLEEQKFRIEAEQKQSYNLAVMIRAAVGEKRMPDYERFFGSRKAKEAKGPMTDEQMYRQVLALNAALGGTVSGE